MPDVILFQPEPENNPVDRWEFRFQPVGPDEFPMEDYYEPLAYAAGDITDFSCAGDWLRPYCESTVTPAADMFDLGRFESEVQDCMSFERNCYTVPVEEPLTPDGWITARAFGSVEGTSEWSKPLVVPELDFVFTMAVAVLFLGAIIHEQARERSRSRTLHGVRVEGQRRTVRGWLREVLRRGLRLVGRGK